MRVTPGNRFIREFLSWYSVTVNVSYNWDPILPGASDYWYPSLEYAVNNQMYSRQALMKVPGNGHPSHRSHGYNRV